MSALHERAMEASFYCEAQDVGFFQEPGDGKHVTASSVIVALALALKNAVSVIDAAERFAPEIDEQIPTFSARIATFKASLT